MSKYFLPLVLISFLFSRCENAIKDEVVSEKETPEQTVVVEEPTLSNVNDNKTVGEPVDLIGYWTGWFLPDEEEIDHTKNVYAGEGFYWSRENKITISIDTLRSDSVIGHSVVAGNFRPFQGNIEFKHGFYIINAREPGDNKYDGDFFFSVELDQDTVKGTWQAYKKIQTPKRKYQLTKQKFEYKPEAKIRTQFVDWIKKKTRKEDWGDGYMEDIESYFTTTEKVTSVNPSIDVLTEEEVSNLTKADIYVLRNSIYAKHGYSFKKRQLRVFFDSHDWYMPVHVNIKSDLTDIEKKNIKLLLRYEKYAEEYYDEFGRG